VLVPAKPSLARRDLGTLKPWTGGVGIPLDDILAGAHDTMVRGRAQAAKAAEGRFFLRWGHEMNGSGYPWDGSHNGANAAAAAKYVAVYRRLHDLFIAEGASNVLRVFCPTSRACRAMPETNGRAITPDAYVDWMAFDGYNRGTSEAGSTWRAFADVAGVIYSGLAAKGKPIMIAATASTEVGADKGRPGSGPSCRRCDSRSLPSSS
jgi:beta-mannanase